MGSAIVRAAGRGLRSIRLRAAVAAAVAAAIVFGLGWIWFRDTVYTAQMDAAIARAWADAETIATTSFPDGASRPVVASPASYFAPWVVVFADGEVINGGFPVDDLLASGLLTLPGYGRDWVPLLTTRLGDLPDDRWNPLEGRTVTFVSTPVDPDTWAQLLGQPLGTPGRKDSPPFEKGRPPGSPPPQAVVYVLASPDEAGWAVAKVDSFLARGLPLAAIFVGLIAWIVTGLALRPVEKIRARLAEVSSRRLGERVPVPRSGDEISRLAVTTNATLDRLEDAVNRQRAFVADAAHELRSPLTSLRSALEVALAHPDRADWPDVVRAGLRDTARLQGLTDDLLLLARLDRVGAAGVNEVDLAALVEEQVAERRYLHPGSPSFTATTAPGARLTGDEAQLGRLLRNLLDNAARHAGSAVWVSVEQDRPGWFRLTVADDGPGIPAEERERVFERFARLDEARSRDDGGSGLGLAIARDIATGHRGTLTIGDSTRGTRMIVRLPGSCVAVDDD